MIFEVKCDEELTDRTHTRIVSFISTDVFAFLLAFYLKDTSIYGYFILEES